MNATSNHPAPAFALPSKAFPALYHLHSRGREDSPPLLELPPRVSAFPLVAPFFRDSKHASGARAGPRARAKARVVAGASTVGRCTYGEGNSLWLTQELERLLSVQSLVRGTSSLEINSIRRQRKSSIFGTGRLRADTLETMLEIHTPVQKRPGNGLVLTRGRWSWDLQDEDHYQLIGKMEFHNITEKFEIFVPEVQGKLQLLAGTSICPQHPQGKPAPRKDGYWPAYIICAGESTSIEVSVDIFSREGISLTGLEAARLEIEYISYGPHGRSTHVQHVVLPLQFLDGYSSNNRWRNITARPKSFLLPIRTHLLSHLDDPLEVLRRYVLPHAEAGDIIAIGETPLAIMQGRFRHPRTVRPGLVAGLACRLFHPTSSLATACGMQALVDISGRLRVVVAVFIAVIARLLGKRGVFYQVAGEQARLIDDVTGTLPPYDQFITLGPVRVQATVDALKTKTGCEVAIVDVNDLRRVEILATMVPSTQIETARTEAEKIFAGLGLKIASHGVDHQFLEAALLDNPAGNADEQTPIILIRKSDSRS